MKKQNFMKRLVCLMLAVMLILSGSSVTAFAADDVMMAYDAISKAFAKFTPSDSTTEQDVLDYAKKALPSGSTVTLEIKDFKNTPALEKEAGGNTTYGVVEANIIIGKAITFNVRKLIPKAKASDEKKLTEDWEAMSHAMHQVKVSNKTTEEELLKAALSASKNGTTAKWTKFIKVDATYEKKGDITGYMTMTLGGKSKELRFHEEIPMLQRKRPSKKQCDVASKDWEILRQTNIERFKEGLSLLTMVQPLQGVTCIRAEELNKQPSLKHTRPDGTSFRTAVPASFVNAGLGENIYNCKTNKFSATAAVVGWMNSKPHRANILRKDYDYIGITSYETQSVQIFAISKYPITSYTTSAGKKTFKSVEEMEGEYLICKDSSGLKSYLPLDTSYMTKVKDGYTLKLNSKKTIKLTIKGSSTGTSTGTSTTSKFTDVESEDAKAVDWVVKKKIMTGINSTKFSPKASCTRADVFTYLYKANGSPTPQSKNWFADVKSTDTFYKPALWAQEKGLVDWGMLYPNDVCLKSYALYYVWMSVGEPEPTQKTTFTDFNDWVFYAKAVAWAEEKGIIKNTGDNKFNGDSAVCTRADIANFLYGAYNK
ncbi:MAG: S-layer homology domain-containing protein [Eubacterium sp.]|nr:S-layer homology domain-containing protein [Eubacterium sp.]